MPCYYGIGVVAYGSANASFTLLVANASEPVYLVCGVAVNSRLWFRWRPDTQLAGGTPTTRLCVAAYLVVFAR